MEEAWFTKTLGEATIMPIHFKYWAHFTEDRAEIEQAFTVAGREK